MSAKIKFQNVMKAKIFKTFDSDSSAAGTGKGWWSECRARAEGVKEKRGRDYFLFSSQFLNFQLLLLYLY
jgi:hypothetical protein